MFPCSSYFDAFIKLIQKCVAACSKCGRSLFTVPPFVVGSSGKQREAIHGSSATLIFCFRNARVFAGQLMAFTNEGK